MKNYIPLSTDWYFYLTEEKDYSSVDFAKEKGHLVRLPHDWSISQAFSQDAPCGSYGGFLPTGSAWYSKKVFLSFAKDEHIFLDISGFFNEIDVYINDRFVSHEVYGYFGLYIEITDFLVNGENRFAFFVDASKQPATRWYSGAGVFRPVSLKVFSSSYILPKSVHIISDFLNESGYLTVTADIENFISGMKLFYSLETEQGILEGEMVLKTKKAIFVLDNIDVLPWSPSSPRLYQLLIRLNKDETIDTFSFRVGFRHFDFIPHKGMFLNGKPIKFKGVCLHYNYGVSGMAVVQSSMIRRLTLLKNMGVNAIRMGHSFFGSAFLSLCDELGIMVIAECFDSWDNKKIDFDYSRFFKKNYTRHLKKFVQDSRNYTSVVLWSIGNEVINGSVSRQKMLMGYIHQLDSRPVTCGVQGTGELSDVLRRNLDIAGYNDGGGACFIYERDHKQRPEQLFVATESPHTLQTRGFYRTLTWWRDKNTPRKEIPNLTDSEVFTDGCEFYHSSYDNAGVRLNARDCWKQTVSLPYLIGEFRWTGADYYGESLSWPAKSLGYGVIDTAGFPKDHYYLYQAMWNEEKKILHVLPHWTHRKMAQGTVIPIIVYSNCESVELLLNGISYGKKNIDFYGTRFNIPYEPGRIDVLGYDNETIVISTTSQTACTPKGVMVEDFIPPKSDTVHEFHFSLIDEKGIECPDSNQTLGIYVLNGELIGTENGNHVDLTCISSPIRDTFYGKVMAMIRGDSPQFVIGAILGSRYFDESTKVELYLDYFHISDRNYALCYKIDDSKEQLYLTPFTIYSTCNITYILKNIDDEVLFTFSSVFKKEKEPQFIDLTHGNRELLSEVPAGPFAQKLWGYWKSDEYLLEFKSDGVVLQISEFNERAIGWWWYDFPVDFFEAQEYTGTGEIWFHTGEKQKIKLLYEDQDKLVLDNSKQGFATAFGYSKEIIFKREAGNDS